MALFAYSVVIKNEEGFEPACNGSGGEWKAHGGVAGVESDAYLTPGEVIAVKRYDLIATDENARGEQGGLNNVLRSDIRGNVPKNYRIFTSA